MLRPCNLPRILGRHDPPLAPSRRPAFVQDDVDGETVQPGAERAVAPERAHLIPQPHEDILRALVGIARIAGEAKTERIHAARMPAIQLPESRLVASLRTGDEIVRGGHRTKTPPAAAAFGAESRQANPREIAQPPLELFLQFVQARALL